MKERRISRRTVLILGSLCSLFAATRVDARVALRGEVTASWGVTDNVEFQSSDPEPGQQGAEADLFTQLAPGVALSAIGDRAIYDLRYTFFANLYMSHGAANSYANRLDANALFQLTERTRWTLNVAGVQARQNAFGLTEGATTTLLAPQPVGNVTFAATSFMSQLEHDFDPAWTGFQTTYFNTYLPIDGDVVQPHGLELVAQLGASRSWERLLISTTLGIIDGMALSYTDATNITIPLEHQMLGTGELSARYQLAEAWHVSAGGGVAVSEGPFAMPLANAAIQYDQEHLGQFELNYHHAADPNLSLGQTALVTDAVSLAGGIPLGRNSHLRLLGSAGYEFSRDIDVATNTTGDAFHVFSTDGMVQWIPWENLEVGLRYQFNFQSTGGATPANVSASGFQRHAVILSFTGHYPGIEEASRSFLPRQQRAPTESEWKKSFDAVQK